MDKYTVLKALERKTTTVSKAKNNHSYSCGYHGYKAVLKKPLIGYKRVYNEYGTSKGTAIVKLEIPAGATVICGTDYSIHRMLPGGVNIDLVKLRTNKAKVLYVKGLRSKRDVPAGYATNGFIYEAGKIVTPKNGFVNNYTTCAAGIHFFLTRKEAQVY